jgi:hypothetical protein
MEPSEMRLATRSIHAGDPEPRFAGALEVPIFSRCFLSNSKRLPPMMTFDTRGLTTCPTRLGWQASWLVWREAKMRS